MTHPKSPSCRAQVTASEYEDILAEVRFAADASVEPASGANVCRSTCCVLALLALSVHYHQVASFCHSKLILLGATFYGILRSCMFLIVAK